MSKQPIIYYAHAMSWYGTDAERYDMEELAKHGTAINPNSSEFEVKVGVAKRTGFPVMQIFADYIREKVDVVAFRAFSDYRVGAGVAREVFEAQIWGKEIWEITGHPYSVARSIRKRGVTMPLSSVCTVAETRRRIEEKFR